ncbi:hypothetical protein CsSME_00009006 [Camellia sinensis var. sinensis]
MLLAWALNPPSAPAMAEPVRFFSMFSSTNDATSVFRTFSTTASFIITSQTTDLPRPSIQFTAAGFLSEQKFPAKFTTTTKPYQSSIAVLHKERKRERVFYLIVIKQYSKYQRCQSHPCPSSHS